MTPLLEREPELRAADALLADARRERGRLLFVEAGPGFGKSTLIEHVVARADGFRVLRAAGRELERELGWGVARSLFEPVVDGASLSGPAAALSLAHDATLAHQGTTVSTTLALKLAKSVDTGKLHLELAATDKEGNVQTDLFPGL